MKTTNLAGKSHTPADDGVRVLDVGGHHAELAALDKLDQVGELLLERGLLLVLLDIWVGVLAASVGVAETRRHGCGCAMKIASLWCG